MLNKIKKIFHGHIDIGNLTIYGRNAMHFGITYYTRRYGFICFRLPFLCFGRWWPLYFYLSPNGTPNRSTFYLGKGLNKLEKNIVKFVDVYLDIIIDTCMI